MLYHKCHIAIHTVTSCSAKTLFIFKIGKIYRIVRHNTSSFVKNIPSSKTNMRHSTLYSIRTSVQRRPSLLKVILGQLNQFPKIDHLKSSTSQTVKNVML